ncbi:hypothetical protein [Candidatus Accumulibacter sp. ACC012]|uniref:hypothetical protein n=1 Tax=Candidatus Accumulibacter sp. ACC012 TaxID=2823332 RepID=UPI0025C3227B|nr:hypothetical protein [Candidatus Accumulibacter sp. ACC012]
MITKATERAGRYTSSFGTRQRADRDQLCRAETHIAVSIISAKTGRSSAQRLGIGGTSTKLCQVRPRGNCRRAGTTLEDDEIASKAGHQ